MNIVSSCKKLLLSVVVGFSWLGHAHAASFGAPTNTAVGNSPYATAVGDLNNNVDLDMVVADGGPSASADNTVSVLLNDGALSFTTSTETVGLRPRWVEVADLEPDGDLDVVVANAGTGASGTTVSVLLGNGDGSFAAAVDYTVGTDPRNLAIGDVNDDTKPDLVVANFADNTISVLLGNGDGTFAAKTDFSTPTKPFAVQLADLNNDGNTDVAVNSFDGGSVNLFFGNGDGTFGPLDASLAVGTQPHGLAVGDVDGDGNLDLATANGGSDNISLLLNNDLGNFVPPNIQTLPLAAGAAPSDVFIGDVNDDGNVDLVVAESGTDTVSVLEGHSAGGFGAFQPFPVVPNGTPQHLDVVDMNIDSKLDLVVSNLDSANVSILLNDLATEILASSLPASRSVQVGNPATAFTTIINSGTTPASGCGIAPLTNVPGTFTYQTTDPNTNALTGTANTPVDIAAGGSQSYIFAFDPTAEFGPDDVLLSYNCADTAPAPVTVGLTTLFFSASTNPVPDFVALAATPSGDGIVSLPSTTGANAFALASVNVGVDGINIAVTADTGAADLPLGLSICETNPATGQCLSPPTASVTTDITAAATPTFAIFVTGTGTAVPLDPANSRIFVRFKDAADVTRGSTSVAVRTL